MGYLYKLTFPSGKSYIGITTTTPQRRFLGHKYAARNNFAFPLYKAWRKYGDPALTVLAIMENGSLKESEVLAISTYKTFAPKGYNRTRGGDGVPGLTQSLNARDAVARANSARIITLETRKKLSDSAIRRGMSRKTIEKARAANLGRKLSHEHIEKLRISSIRLNPKTNARRSATLKMYWSKKRMATNMEGVNSEEIDAHPNPTQRIEPV